MLTDNMHFKSRPTNMSIMLLFTIMSMKDTPQSTRSRSSKTISSVSTAAMMHMPSM